MEAAGWIAAAVAVVVVAGVGVGVGLAKAAIWLGERGVVACVKGAKLRRPYCRLIDKGVLSAVFVSDICKING